MGLRDLFKKKDPKYTSVLALIAVAMADGEFADEEKKAIATACVHMGISSQDLEFCLNHPDRIKPSMPKSMDDKISTISGMITVMVSDGEIDSHEMAICKKFAMACGLDPSFVDKAATDALKNLQSYSS